MPIFLFISLAIKLEDQGQVIYWSERIGKEKRTFKMPKFRTMAMNSPQIATHLLENPDELITKVGSFMRRYSIDELPQLWSILIGDMSFVGPRPALFNQDDLVRARDQGSINSLRPGLTGWAQVNGRDNLSIEEKVEFEKEYKSRASILFDFGIILKTFKIVITRFGVKH
tara:strand:- start:2598 stop:3107 length:510 start_codon:yes stop_codon:yes gene_type:complete